MKDKQPNCLKLRKKFLAEKTYSVKTKRCGNPPIPSTSVPGAMWLWKEAVGHEVGAGSTKLFMVRQGRNRLRKQGHWFTNFSSMFFCFLQLSNEFKTGKGSKSSEKKEEWGVQTLDKLVHCCAMFKHNSGKPET